MRGPKRLNLIIGLALSALVVGGIAMAVDNGKVRVHSAEQAAEMAKAAAGPRVASLPMRVETEQDFWIIRFGPDGDKRMHSYLVTLWDKKAEPLMAEVTDQANIIVDK